ncbi:MAG: cytochrome c oxidase assembly protein [Microbacteriaceae bacterium]
MIVLTTWGIDPGALAVILVAAVAYGYGILLLRKRSIQWPVLPTLGFYLLGLGSYAVVAFGFLTVESSELRWAFTTRIALLLFVVPGLISLGKPITLAKQVLSGMSLRVIDAVLSSWPARMLGNAIFGPLLAIAAFTIFLTPLAGTLRGSALAEALITVVVPVIGLLMVLPIIENTTQRTSLFITAEFMLALVELVADAIPAIFLRLSNSILDHAPAVVQAMPAWFPSPLRDQQLSGDLLWFIVEVSDVPVLILLFIRWSKTDRREAQGLDDLSDEEMAALTREHLRSRHD